MRENYACFECGTKLTDKEMREWYDTATYCCDGYMCGCRGEPNDPPICDSCGKEFTIKHQLNEIEKLNNIINNMAEYIETQDIDEEICKKVSGNCDWVKHNCKACIINHFAKKENKHEAL